MKKSIIRTGIALIFFFLLACGVSAKPGFYNLLEMEEVAVGLDTDGSGNLYALLGNGDIIKIDGNNKTETVYSGIKKSEIHCCRWEISTCQGF